MSTESTRPEWLQEAEQHLIRAVELTDTYCDPFKNLALLYSYTGRCAKPRELLDQYERCKIPPGPDADGRRRVNTCREGQMRIPDQQDFLK